MLSTEDLLALTQTLPNSLGVFSINTLPDLSSLSLGKELKGKAYRTLIVNLDIDQLPGSHWVGIYKEDGVIEIFDSFGFPPPPLLQAWAVKNGRKWIYRHGVSIQHPLAVTCGYYAFIFTLARPYYNDYDSTLAYICTIRI